MVARGDQCPELRRLVRGAATVAGREARYRALCNPRAAEWHTSEAAALRGRLAALGCRYEAAPRGAVRWFSPGDVPGGCPDCGDARERLSLLLGACPQCKREGRRPAETPGRRRPADESAGVVVPFCRPPKGGQDGR